MVVGHTKKGETRGTSHMLICTMSCATRCCHIPPYGTVRSKVLGCRNNASRHHDAAEQGHSRAQAVALQHTPHTGASGMHLGNPCALARHTSLWAVLKQLTDPAPTHASSVYRHPHHNFTTLHFSHNTERHKLAHSSAAHTHPGDLAALHNHFPSASHSRLVPVLQPLNLRVAAWHHEQQLLPPLPAARLNHRCLALRQPPHRLIKPLHTFSCAFCCVCSRKHATQVLQTVPCTRFAMLVIGCFWALVSKVYARQ